MVDRESVREAIQDTLEVITAGKWHIASAEYNGIERAAQGESRPEAVDKLVSRIYKSEKETEQHNEAAKRRKERFEQRDQRREAYEDRARVSNNEYIDRHKNR